VHLTVNHHWKKALLEGAADIFERGNKQTSEINEDMVRSLHSKIGELAVANELKIRGAILSRESSSLGPGGEARDDRKEPLKPLDWGAMPPAVGLVVVILRRADE
jgi:hypothetical protein